MLFGITPREWGEFFEDAYRQVRAAEETGYDSIWFEEHHQHPTYLPSPLQALATMSGHTKLRLGTNIIILPLHNPYQLAEEIAQLDCSSHGRVIAGLAAGYRDKDFRNFGVKLEERGAVMDEAVSVLKELLSREHVTHDGRDFQITDATIQPRPHQKPRPPIWIGGWKKPALRRAAQMADAWFPGPTASFTDVLKAKQIYEDEISRLGKQMPKLPIMRDVYVAETTDVAYEECRSSFEYMYGEDYSSSGHPLLGGQRHTFEEWAHDRFIIGNPDVASEEIAKFEKNGFHYVVLRASLRKLSCEQTVRSIRLIGEQVLPRFPENEGDFPAVVV